MFVRTILLLSIATAAAFAQDSLNVELVGRLFNQWDAAHGVTVSGNFAYVAADSNGLCVISVTDPEHPEVVGFCDTPDRALGVTISGNYAYVADGISGLRIISVADPEHPEEVGNYYTDRCVMIGVAVSGDYAFIADWDRGLHVISVADPIHPEEVGIYDTRDRAHGVTVHGNYVYVADSPSFNGEEFVGGGLRIVSVTDPEQPEEVGYYDTPGSATNVTVFGNYAYVADGESGLRIISVTDPEHPEEVGYYDTDGATYGVAVSGDYAYLGDWESGLRIISVADPEHPEEVGYYDTPGRVWGISLSEDGLIYVADWTNMGIYRFTPNAIGDSEPAPPLKFNLSPSYPNPFNSTTMITYQLPNPGLVSLRVYSLSGERMSTLLEGYRQSGTHEVTLKADGWASGVYLARLQIGSDLRTQRLVLVR